MRVLFTMIVAVALAGCASVARQLDYPSTWPDADVWVGEHQYALWFHPERQTVLLRRGPPQRLAVALAEGWTIYSNDRTEPTLVWGRAADAVLQQIGCYGVDMQGSDQVREVNFVCPQAVDIQREVAARRDQWRAGVRTDMPPLPS